MYGTFPQNQTRRKVPVGSVEIPLRGVDEILDDFYLEGWLPEDKDLQEELSPALREAGNHLSPGMESACGAAVFIWATIVSAASAFLFTVFKRSSILPRSVCRSANPS